MKIVLTLGSWFLILLSIGLFITAFCYFWPYIEKVMIGSKNIKTAMAVVTGSSTTLHTYRHGGSTSRASTKEFDIIFTDEDGTVFEHTLKPVFFNFKEGKKIKVKYGYGKATKDYVKYFKEKNHTSPISKIAVPTNVFYSLERPLLFLIAGLIALSISYVPRAMRDMERTINLKEFRSNF